MNDLIAFLAQNRDLRGEDFHSFHLVINRFISSMIPFSVKSCQDLCSLIRFSSFSSKMNWNSSDTRSFLTKMFGEIEFFTKQIIRIKSHEFLVRG